MSYRDLVYGILGAALTSRLKAGNLGANSLRPTILIQSFDGYKRFWTPAIESVVRYLPGELPVYFASNNFDEAPPIMAKVQDRVNFIKTGNGSFAMRAYRAIRQLPIHSRVILYLQEDMWLEKPVSLQSLSEWCSDLCSLNLVSLKLCRGAFISSEMPDSDFPIESKLTPRIALFGKRSYCMSHHVTLFDRDFLSRSFLIAHALGRSGPFEHEYFISNILRHSSRERTRESSGIAIGVYMGDPLVSYVHASEKGRLTIEGSKWLARHGLAEHEFKPARSTHINVSN